MGVMCVLCAVTNRFSLVLHILQGRSQGGGGGGGGFLGYEETPPPPDNERSTKMYKKVRPLECTKTVDLLDQ